MANNFEDVSHGYGAFFDNLFLCDNVSKSGMSAVPTITGWTLARFSKQTESLKKTSMTATSSPGTNFCTTCGRRMSSETRKFRSPALMMDVATRSFTLRQNFLGRFPNGCRKRKTRPKLSSMNSYPFCFSKTSRPASTIFCNGGKLNVHYPE